MKITYNNKEVFELNETQKKVIQNDIPTEIFDNDMTRRCKYWLESPAEKHVHAHKEKMIGKLKEKKEKSLPVNDVKLGVRFAELEPCKCGYDDIEDVECKVGLQSFSFSKDHRKIWRKMKEREQESKDHDAYLADEEKELADRMAWILKHKYERCFERLKNEWLPKLEQRGVQDVPLDDDELAELIFSQPDYKNRSERDRDDN